MRMAILGLGVVGGAVARLVRANHAGALTISHVLNRHAARKREASGALVPEAEWTERIDDILDAHVDVVVETMGGVEPAASYIRRALDSGVSVVTANKQVVARHGRELTAAAAASGVHLRFEGAVAGGIPVLRAIEEGLRADRLSRVAGVLNGTSTHILSRMEAGDRFPDALAEAQALGFAEADPSDDLSGGDAAAKLAILSATALGRPIRCTDISCRSIAPIEPIDFRYAGELGCTIRQVAWAERHDDRQAVVAAVRPALVSRRLPLARVTGSENVVTVRGEFGGETAFFGRGAGGDATAVAVVSDLLAVADARLRRGGDAPRRRGFEAEVSAVCADYSAPHYVRFTVADRPGILAAVADAFARQRISINAVLQHPGWPSGRLPFVMTLEECAEHRMDAALAEIAAMDFHVQPPVVLPVFDVQGGAV